MRYVKWTLLVLLIAVIGGFLHYTLPQRDIVRIVGIENRRIDTSTGTGFVTSDGTRDVRFVLAVRPSGRELVYRNEDTGWGWPPYFKFNSSTLQARAQNYVSTSANPQWVAITHYGWRLELFSMFPNAVRIRPVEGPDVTLVPWGPIVILTILAALMLLVWRLWVRFRENRLEPFWDGIAERRDARRRARRR
ncbi:DUF1523 family protein [Plastorhodobacter daqingensis]|uniref:DUF1523 family protein n=1 Tax=Plastorhodobacter daqingensis TaxID=1387281 RepID=A0ABW2UPA2_9RHOB